VFSNHVDTSVKRSRSSKRLSGESALLDNEIQRIWQYMSLEKSQTDIQDEDYGYLILFANNGITNIPTSVLGCLARSQSCTCH
jgi:hypothetical protein